MENNNKNNNKEELFWADKIAKEIINRKKFRYNEQEIPKFDEFTVKTSASLSGVLHIGRLSDTIRSESVFRALKDAGVKSRLIWVAEDMDPLRKVPKNVPKDFSKYLGMAVTDIPDPDGNYESYADKFREEYLKVIDDFTFTKMEKYSMREEYKKGNFKEYIQKIMENIDTIREINNKFRTHKLPKTWSPWVPICENCGKIATPSLKRIEDGIITYECEDYSFEKTKATGCGHKGSADPLKDDGKLMWKSEWAAQWKRWKVVSEGAGKEYQVPNSAFWINAEIVEKVLGYPMPEPIFYEHIMIDGVKMSASLGNVVYPKDWLSVAPSQLLRMFYNKKLMKTRSFSWKDLPRMYNEVDSYSKVSAGVTKLDNEKETEHIKRLYEISFGEKKLAPLDMTFSHAIVLAQIFPEKEDIINSLKKTGQYQEKYEKEIFERIDMAKNWLTKYAEDDQKFTLQEKFDETIKLEDSQKEALKNVLDIIKTKKPSEEELHQFFYDTCKSLKIELRDFFKITYQIFLKRDRGPKLANFLLTLDKRAIDLLEQATKE